MTISKNYGTALILRDRQGVNQYKKHFRHEGNILLAMLTQNSSLLEFVDAIAHIIHPHCRRDDFFVVSWREDLSYWSIAHRDLTKNVYSCVPPNFIVFLRNVSRLMPVSS